MDLDLTQLKIIKLALEKQQKEFSKLAKAERQGNGLGLMGNMFNELLSEAEHLQRRIDLAIEDIESPCEMVTGELK